jgi:hypothetical protein
MKPLNHLFTLPTERQMNRLHLLSLAGRDPEIGLAARDTVSDSVAGVFLGYFVVEGSEGDVVEGLGGFEVADEEGSVCDWHVDGCLESFEVWDRFQCLGFDT